MAKGTDNSHLMMKVLVREEMLLELGKTDISVLECYGGKGVIWATIEQRNPQLEIIAKKRYSGYVAITDINSMMGVIPYAYLEAAGIAKEKYRKCPMIFKCLNDRLLENFLYICKAKRLKGYFLKGERKNYFYTQLNQL